jgi:hypothetical protein
VDGLSATIARALLPGRLSKQKEKLMSSFQTLFYLLLLFLWVIGVWTTFEKAGEPGWAAIIPIYNGIVMLRIVRRPIWWLILWFIPFVNFIVWLIIGIDVAKAFGRGAGFGVGLGFLGPIFFPILGFSDARYNGARLSGSYR